MKTKIIVCITILAGVAACRGDGALIVAPDVVMEEKDLRTEVPLVTDSAVFDSDGVRVAVLSSKPLGGGRVWVLYHVYAKDTNHWIRIASGSIDMVQEIRAKIVDGSIVIEGRMVCEPAEWKLQKRICLKDALTLGRAERVTP